MVSVSVLVFTRKFVCRARWQNFGLGLDLEAKISIMAGLKAKGLIFVSFLRLWPRLSLY